MSFSADVEQFIHVELEFLRLEFCRNSFEEEEQDRRRKTRFKRRRRTKHYLEKRNKRGGRRRTKHNLEKRKNGGRRRRTEHDLEKKKSRGRRTRTNVDLENGGTRVPHGFFSMLDCHHFVTRVLEIWVSSLNSSFRHSRYYFAK